MAHRHKLKGLVAYPNGDLALVDMQADDRGIVREKDGTARVLTSHPMLYRRGKRLVPWNRFEFIHAFFAGDGEELDFTEGRGNDYRTPPEELSDEDAWEKEADAYAERQLKAIRFGAELNDLMVLRDQQHNGTDNGGGGLTTIAVIAAAFVLVLLVITYTQNQGGLGEVFDLGKVALTPTPAPTP